MGRCTETSTGVAPARLRLGAAGDRLIRGAATSAAATLDNHGRAVILETHTQDEARPDQARARTSASFRIHVSGRLPKPGLKSPDDTGEACGIDHGVVHADDAANDQGDIRTCRPRRRTGGTNRPPSTPKLLGVPQPQVSDWRERPLPRPRSFQPHQARPRRSIAQWTRLHRRKSTRTTTGSRQGGAVWTRSRPEPRSDIAVSCSQGRCAS